MPNKIVRALMTFGLGLAASAAHAQVPPPPSDAGYAPPPGASYGPPPEEAAAAPDGTAALPARHRPANRPRLEFHPYLEVAQVVSADLDAGDTLTYSSVAAGVDGQIHTRRVNVAIGVRYEREIAWNHGVGDTDSLSGIALLNAQIVPGTVSFDAGALATRTGGEGRALGVTARDSSVDVYSAYAGPTLTTHAGPLSINANYRLGYVQVDDHIPGPSVADDFDNATAHNANASIGMAPGPLPIGWNVTAGWARTDNHGPFRDRFEGEFVRGDVVVPVGPTLALTAGVGYENYEASQRDIARDAAGAPVIGPNGRPVADPTRPRVLTYKVDDILYDGGLIWRPSARTELQVRAGHRYGGTTVVGTFSHQFSPHSAMSAAVYDSQQTVGNQLITDLSSLPNDAQVTRDPITGNLNGCVFGSDPGRGGCLSNSLQSIRSGTFRLRGASLVFSGERGLWSWGLGGGYAHRSYARPTDPAFLLLGAGSDESVTLSGSLTRRLSRNTEVALDVYASWFDTDQVGFRSVTSTGATVSYTRRMLLERLRFLAAIGLYHTDNGVVDDTVLTGLAGLSYTF